jgi:hypothetical protein
MPSQIRFHERLERQIQHETEQEQIQYDAQQVASTKD